MKTGAILILMLLLVRETLSAETAVLPYRVLNPSEYFSESKGGEYARLIYVTALATKNVPVASPESIEIDIANMGLGQVITDDEAARMGRTRGFSYIVAGSLTRIQGSFVSRTRLYSVRDSRIILERENRAADLFNLALMDVKDLFATAPDASPAGTRGIVDMAILIDLSHAARTEHNDLRQGVHSLYRALCDTRGYDAVIHTVPVSDAIALERSLTARTPLALKQQLSGYAPAGKTGNAEFTAAFRHAIKNLRWRRESRKFIIAAVNSDIAPSINLESLGFEARKINIPLYALFGARVSEGGAHPLRQICITTGGAFFHATYRRGIVAALGKQSDLYLERGRLFHSLLPGAAWKKGVLKPDPSNPSYVAVDERFDEIPAGDRGPVKADSMITHFERHSGETVLKAHGLENNIPALFDAVLSHFTRGSSASETVTARVLLSDGRVSFWTSVSDRAMLSFLADKERRKHFFTMGFQLRENNDENHGLEFVPRLTGFSSRDVPDLAKTDITAIVTDRRRHLLTGTAGQPLWFMSVKVEEIEGYGETRDIREP
jgi:hypothetical protein